MADSGFPDVFTARDRHRDVVRALEAVGNDDRASGGEGSEAVLPCTIEVFERVLAASGVESVAVGQEGLASESFYNVHDRPRIVGAQESHVAELPEVHLDRDELAVHVDAAYSGGVDQSLELVRRAFVRPAAEICEIYLRHWSVN